MSVLIKLFHLHSSFCNMLFHMKFIKKMWPPTEMWEKGGHFHPERVTHLGNHESGCPRISSFVGLLGLY